MTSDGVMFSNEGRGYVLRRLLRRAVRHGKLLGIEGLFLTRIAKVVIECSKDAYKELEEKKDFILKAIESEEEKFNQTIKIGMDILDNNIKELEKNKKKELSGKDAFKLYDTYGFPVELTEEILTITPLAPLIDVSSNLESIAILAASVALPSPLAEPIPISAEPEACITLLTSAKSTFIIPGTVMISEIP